MLFSQWCSICGALSPILEELAEELKGMVEFTKVDIDENPQLIEKFNITSVPSLLLFQKGKLIKKLIDSETKEGILSPLCQYI
jgi:thioredoxin 1